MSKLSWTVLLVASMAGIAVFFPVTKLLGGTVEPLLLTFFRFSIASAALLPFILLQRRSLVIPPAKDIAVFAFIAVCGAIPTALIVASIEHTNSIVAAILINTNPLMVAILAPLLISEKITSTKIFGLVVGFLGVISVVLNGQDPLVHLNSSYLWGALVLLGAALFAALNKTFSKGLVRKYDGLYVTFFSITLGSILLGLVVTLQNGFAQVAEFTPTTFLSLFVIGVVCSAVPWVIWSSSLKHLEVHVAASFSLLIPIFATLYSLIFLTEELTSWMLFGMALTSVGIYIIQREEKVAPSV